MKQTAEFLEAILPRTGYYVIAAQNPRTQRVTHKVFEHIPQMAKAARVYDAKGFTVYHACCTVVEPEGVWNEEKQRWQIRVKRNVEAVRAQWLDIDVGEGKDFPTRKAAAAALAAMCKHFRIPRPLIVSSGRGFHCYWPFTEELTAPEFLRLARHFSESLKAYGFPHDTKPTRNVVTLLRPVGTHHRKREELRVEWKTNCEPLDASEFYNAFGELRTDVRDPGEQLTAAQQALMDEWSTGTQPVYAPSDPKKVAKKCPAIRDFALRKQDADPLAEDHWRNMLGVLKYCEGGEELAHRWSKQSDKRYKRGETQAKLNGWQGGPPKCATIAANCSLCESCPHLEKGRSPVSFGRSENKPPEPKAEEDDVPEKAEVVPVLASTLEQFQNKIPKTKNNPLPFWHPHYSWDGHNVRKWVPDGDDSGEHVQFSDILYYPFLRYEKADGTRAALICALVNPKAQRWKTFELDLSKVSEPRTLAIELAAHEILYTKKSQPMHQQFVQDILQGLRQAGLESKTYSNFGWHDDGFVLGDKMITDKGERPVFLSKRVPSDLREGLGAKGSFEAWRDAVDKVYNRKGAEGQQAIICAMAGSVLVHLCNSDLFHGQPIGAVGEPGTGKSATAQVGLSIFGNPSKLTLIANAEGTTMNALISRMAVHRHLPILLDEVTGRTSAELSSLVFALSSGRPKARLKSDGTEVDYAASWDTTSVITGNTNMLNMLSEADRNRASASQVRVLQVDHTRKSVSRVFEGVNGKRDIEKNILTENYGVVGERYLKYVVQNRGKVEGRLQNKLQKFADHSEDPAERFHYALAAVALEAGYILKTLGAIDFDLARIRIWFFKHINSNREERQRVQLTPEDYLQEFISWLSHRTIVTLKYDAEGKTKVEEEFTEEPRFDYVARHATADEVFIVLKTGFVQWCREHKQKPDSEWLLQEFENAGYIKTARLTDEHRHRITKGTTLKGTRARCLEFVYSKLSEMDLPTAAQTSD